MGGSPASTSFPLPPADGGPGITAAFYDLGANTLDVTFSRAVKWSTVAAGQIRVYQPGAGFAQNSLTGTQTGISSFTFTMTNSGLTGPFGMLSYNGSPANILGNSDSVPMAPQAFGPFAVAF